MTSAGTPWTRWPEGLRPSQSPVYVRTERFIPAEPGLVWAWLANVRRWPEWVGRYNQLTLTSGDEQLSHGSHFTLQARAMRLSCTVAMAAPQHQLAWQFKGRGIRGYHAWLLVPTTGGVRVITEEVQQGIVPKLGALLINRRLQRQNEAWLAALGERCAAGFPQDIPTAPRLQ